LIDRDATEQFCCRGCRAVRAAIESCGLGNYYRLKTDQTAAAPANPSGRAYADFDEASFLDRHAPLVMEGVRWTELYVEGVHCSACVWLLERLPRAVPGLLEARLDLRRAILRLTWDTRVVALSAIARTLDRFGYAPHAGRDVEARAARQQEDRRVMIRIGVAGAGAGNVMLLAFALYGGYLHGMEVEYTRLFRWTSMLIGLVVLLWPGGLFFRGAWAALRTRSAHLDLPIAIGLAAGAVAGTVNTVLDRGEIYFDSLTGLVFLLLVGRFVQHRLERRAADSVETLFTLTPSFARLREGDRVREVPVESLAPARSPRSDPANPFPPTARSARANRWRTSACSPANRAPCPCARATRSSPARSMWVACCSCASPPRVAPPAWASCLRSSKNAAAARLRSCSSPTAWPAISPWPPSASRH
jgi:Cu2+-exporting ATPase